MIPKFRAWDIRNKRWMTPEIENEEESEIRLNLWGNVLFRLPWYEQSEGSIVTVYANDVFKIMQSIGLKDKNGVEIFEGDICNVEVNMWGDTMTRTGEVIFCEDDIQYQIVIEDFLTITGKSEFEMSEVIGSVYENPELLEVHT